MPFLDLWEKITFIPHEKPYDLHVQDSTALWYRISQDSSQNMYILKTGINNAQNNIAICKYKPLSLRTSYVRHTNYTNRRYKHGS
jgi:hypothetical protein